MRLILFCVYFMLLSFQSFSQNTFPADGPVGIGTTNPTNTLDVVGGINSSGTSTINGLTFGLANPYTRQLHPLGFNFNILSGDGGSYLSLPYNSSSPAHFKNYGLLVDGNVGIGTTSPSSRFTIGVNSNELEGLTLRDGAIVTSMFKYSTLTGENRIGGAASYAYPTIYSGGAECVRITTEGNVGIGTTLPLSRFSIGVNSNELEGLTLRDGTIVTSMFKYSTSTGENRIGGVANYAYPTIYSGGSERVRITTEGNVGIGTISPTEKLSVNGKIRAKEIKVETINWPDYVFKPTHKLATLSEVEQFIKENKHLPEIPSAAEVEKDGVNLGEMNAKLLKKIEELTLHLIEQNKQMQAITAEYRNDNKKLHQEIIELKEKIK